jgi:hypothetical protein
MLIEPFLLKDIILENSLNIFFEINKPNFEKVVFTLDNSHEITSAYFTILYVNNEYRMYYRSSSTPLFKNRDTREFFNTDEISNNEYLCLATSEDGLHFERENYNLVNFMKSSNNNILMHNTCCHNFFPYYDKKNNKLIAISGTQIYNGGLHLFESNDGITWSHVKKIIDESNILPNFTHQNHFDSHNSITYNEKEDVYYIYVRHNYSNRFVQFTKTKDFNEFTKCELINIYNNNDMIIYTPGIFKYENSNYFIGIPTFVQDRNNDFYSKTNSKLLVSKDNINFSVVTNELFDNKIIDSKTLCKFSINSIVPSKDNSKMYIYTHNVLEEFSCITCHSFEMNRMHKIICNDTGFIKTILISLTNKLRINFDVLNEGYIYVELININDEIVYTTNKFYESCNELDTQISFDTIVKQDNYYIKFNMYNCILYSFSYE